MKLNLENFNEFVDLKEKEIMNEYELGVQYINVVSSPYSNTKFLKRLIERSLEKGEKILYIGNNIYGEEIVNVKFSSYEDAIYIKEEFSLVIYDDISSFSRYSRFEILSLISRIIKDSNIKVIAISTECILNSVDTIYLPSVYNDNVFCEPRVIKTTIDFYEEIPSNIFEYLTYFMDSNKDVVIVIPREDKVSKVLENIVSIKDKLKYEEASSNTIRETRGKNIVVTSKNNIWKLPKERCENIIVYCPKVESYHYKELLYISAMGNYGDNKGEIIFLTTKSFFYIEKACFVARKFNKMLWELEILEN